MSTTIAPEPQETTPVTLAERPQSGLSSSACRPPTTLQAMWRRLALSRLSLIEDGRIDLHEGDRQQVFGTPHSAGPDLRINVHDPAFYGSLLWRSDTGAGLSYARGDWTCEDLTAVIRLFIRNTEPTAALQTGLFTRLHGWALRLNHFRQRNTPSGSQRNIAAHYDLGNDFFASFLDPDMAYSCGLFPHEDASLEEASSHKNEHICRTLGLHPEDQVLEIGCGWGGFALHAARRYGCRVVAVTISPRQFAVASRRVQDAGLQDQVQVLLEDYRNLPQKLQRKFSRVVSIEMIEAVGHRFLDAYFATCSRMLRQDGAMLLQGILMSDQLHRQYLKSVDFIRACIFPGGCLPSMSSISQSLARSGDLRVAGLEEMTHHYPPTLMAWRRRLLARQEDLAQRGYGHELIRLWDFYFSYCAAAFLERRIGVNQILLAKPGYQPAGV
jgi:cyclopropane-fatty-acyl-phospholipid synthase